MSNDVSTLQGKVAAGEVTIREGGLRGMITFRGDLSNSKLKSVCKALTGIGVPEMGRAASTGDKGVAWMSPDELLILVPHDQTKDALGKIAKAMKGQHYLAENVSDARTHIIVEGAFSREVIAKLAPADLHPAHFQIGDFRRTRLGQVAAAFWMTDEEIFEVICFRSVGQYAFDLLAASAKAGPVGHF